MDATERTGDMPEPTDRAISGIDLALSKMEERIGEGISQGGDPQTEMLAQTIMDLRAAQSWLMELNSWILRREIEREESR